MKKVKRLPNKCTYEKQNVGKRRRYVTNGALYNADKDLKPTCGVTVKKT